MKAGTLIAVGAGVVGLVGAAVFVARRRGVVAAPASTSTPAVGTVPTVYAFESPRLMTDAEKVAAALKLWSP